MIARIRDGWPRVRALIVKEWRQLFRDPRTKRVIFGSPLLQLLLFGYAVNTDVHDVATIVVDLDRTAASRALQDALVAGGYFRIVERTTDPRAITHALDHGDTVVGVEIPRGFTADLAAGRAHVQLLVDGTNSNTGTVALGYAQRIVQRFTAENAGTPAAGIDLRARAWYNPGLVSRVYNVPAVVGALLLVMALLLTALAIVRERELGTLEPLMVSPLTPAELILGKTIPVAIVAFIDLVLVCAAAILWFDVPFRGSVATLFVGSAFYILAALGIGLFISSISRTQQEAFMSMFLLILPALILSGFMYPVETMPSAFRTLTYLNPVRWFLESVRAIFLKGAGFAELWPQLTFIAISAVVVLALATWRFTRTIRTA